MPFPFSCPFLFLFFSWRKTLFATPYCWDMDSMTTTTTTMFWAVSGFKVKFSETADWVNLKEKHGTYISWLGFEIAKALVVGALRERLSTWKCRYLSSGRRIGPSLKATFSNLSVYFSFVSFLVRVIKRIGWIVFMGEVSEPGSLFGSSLPWLIAWSLISTVVCI